MVTGYLKQNPNNWFEVHAKKGFLITSVCIILFIIAISFLATLLNLGILRYYSFQFINRYSPVMVLDAIFLFCIFKNMNIQNKKSINVIASTTLGMYLFHGNPYLGAILWDGILKIDRVYYSPMFILYLFISTLSLFGIGAVIDLLRMKLLEKPLFNIKNNCIEMCFSKIDQWINEN